MQVVGVAGPVDVGLETAVGAFGSEGLFEEPGEVAVPMEEVALKEIRLGMSEVGHSEIRTVPCIESVWLMCTADQSSHLFREPGAK